MRVATTTFVFACACTHATVAPTGHAGGRDFTAIAASFAIDTVLDGQASETTTGLSFHDYAACGMPIASRPHQFVDIGISFNFVFPLPPGSSNFTVTAPGQYVLGGGTLASGLDGPASAAWNVDTNGGEFTGGTITLASVSDDEIAGELEITSPNGDYVTGQFRAERCR